MVNLSSTYWRVAFWPELAGAAFVAAGFITIGRRISFRVDGLSALGRVFVAASLAAFGAEHFASAQDIMQVVPAWMPWHLFWTYLVGFALLSAATSLIVHRCIRLTGTLLGVMFFLFFALLDVPAIFATPGDRFMWALVAREIFFSAGCWSLAAGLAAGQGRSWSGPAIKACRILMGAVLVFYAVEHILHPEYIPGVPLEKLTIAIIPLPRFWGYLTGSLEFIGGVMLLADRKSRAAAAWLGTALAFVIVIVYLPMFTVARQTGEIMVAINYVFDTLFFAGSILLLSEAIAADSPTSRAE